MRNQSCHCWRAQAFRFLGLVRAFRCNVPVVFFLNATSFATQPNPDKNKYIIPLTIYVPLLISRLVSEYSWCYTANTATISVFNALSISSDNVAAELLSMKREASEAQNHKKEKSCKKL